MFRGSVDDQSAAISRLNNEKQHLIEELQGKESKIARVQQEAREQELKLMVQISELEDQLRIKMESMREARVPKFSILKRRANTEILREHSNNKTKVLEVSCMCLDS